MIKAYAIAYDSNDLDSMAEALVLLDDYRVKINAAMHHLIWSRENDSKNLH